MTVECSSTRFLPLLGMLVLSVLLRYPATAQAQNQGDSVGTVFKLTGSWVTGGHTAKISRSGNALTVDMSAYDRPPAHGSVVDSQTIKITFPDDATFTGRLVPWGTIVWSNRTSWTKL